MKSVIMLIIRKKLGLVYITHYPAPQVASHICQSYNLIGTGHASEVLGILQRLPSVNAAQCRKAETSNEEVEVSVDLFVSHINLVHMLWVFVVFCKCKNVKKIWFSV